MKTVEITGWGAVSPAGWGAAALRDAVEKAVPLRTQTIDRSGRTFLIRTVPGTGEGVPGVNSPRLRRASSITRFAVAAAHEALSTHAQVAPPAAQLGVIVCVMTGCVNYSRRFYDEIVKGLPASPILFPETVFNGPASHVGAVLGTSAINYTLVGDPGTFLSALAVAQDWLTDGLVDGCVVIGAEETDWLTVEAYQLFEEQIVLAEGAGALYLRLAPQNQTSLGHAAVRLSRVTSPSTFGDGPGRFRAAQLVRNELEDVPAGAMLCDSRLSLSKHDAPETAAWSDWRGPVLSPKAILGEALAAGSAWQCVTAMDVLRRGSGPSAVVSVVGCNQQAIGALFERSAH